ncbi:hypothetical protein BH23PLA1_BH23PLA1_10050 [soil metagenome]
MQGRHQSAGFGWLGARFRIVLLLLSLLAMAMILAWSAIGKAVGAESEAEPTSPDPVVLAADQIRVWEEGEERRVLLSGRAAVLQGVEGLRAREVLVRILPERPEAGGPLRLEIHAEGEVRRTDDRETVLDTSGMAFRTLGGVQIRPPYQGGEIVELDAPPEDLPIRSRAFVADPTPPSRSPSAIAQEGGPPLPGEASAKPQGPPVTLLPAPLPVRPPLGALGGTTFDPSVLLAQYEGPADVPERPEAPDAPPSVPTVEEPTPRRRQAADSGPDLPPLAPLRPSRSGEGGSNTLDLPPIPRAEPSPFRVPSATQFRQDGAGFADDPAGGVMPPPSVLPGEDDCSGVDDRPGPGGLPPLPRVRPPVGGESDAFGDDLDLVPLPGSGPLVAPSDPPARPAEPEAFPASPIMPGSLRVINIFGRDGPRLLNYDVLPRGADGTLTTIVTGGVQMIVEDEKRGTIDISADRAVIWTRPKGGSAVGVGMSSQGADDPLEVYLEGNVLILQDKREIAGQEDQNSIKATRLYYDIRLDRFLLIDGEIEQFAPGFVAPLRTMADRITQFRDAARNQQGELILGPALIQSENAVTTGSAFATPGYSFHSRTIDLTEQPPGTRRGPIGQRLLNPLGNPSGDGVYRIDARRNTFFLGPVPAFFWPRFVATTEDINPPLRQISLRTNNLFGQQILTDWDGFKLFAFPKPSYIEDWNVDIDYLSDRGPALGSEVGYFGRDLSSDMLGIDLFPQISGSFFGYSDYWGIYDQGLDNLGGGPAVITEGPPFAGREGIDRSSVPTFRDFRGRTLWRHMQSLLDDSADPLEDFRIQIETSYESDRHFLEQYFKRVFDTGLDQKNRIYAVRQWRNRALTGNVEGVVQDWYTESQWVPKIDYYRQGDAPFGLGRFFTYFQHSGVSYANTQTAAEVNNPGVFAPIPYDPTSLTSNAFQTGRLYTNHELNLPINLEVVRFVPYVQGQLMGWDNQYANALPTLGFDPALTVQDYIREEQGSRLGRAWGAYGARADIMFFRPFPGVESELLNIHGLNHKVNLYADYRNAVSNIPLRRIGVQDDLDDNTYEFVRRYFAMSRFQDGILPPQYNPLLLTLRRTVSPISGTVDVQDSMHTLRLGAFQRLQTKRGPEDRRRIIDYMTLDASTTYFPQSDRDNFGVPFGQTTYNYEWYIGDRTSIFSTGWFDSFDIGGQPVGEEFQGDPFGLSVITAGIYMNRPPRSTFSAAYSIINSGPIATSALNTSIGYWMSPKWFGTFSGVYDFGEGFLVSTGFSLTRIGADFLTSIGFNVTPLQDNYSFVFELVPRFSPTTRLGSAAVPYRPDIRFAPTQ